MEIQKGPGKMTLEEFENLTPKIFTIETALACNLKCPECAIGGDMIGRAKNLMRFEKFQVIADKIRPYADYVYLHLWGEPMLNKKIFDMIEYASDFANTNISTNALLLDREKAERLIASGVTSLIVSIDGFSQEVYEKYRVGGNVIDALERLVWLQEFNIKYGMKVHLMPQFIVFKHNQHEMQQFRDFCRSIGLEPLFKAPYIRNEDSMFQKPDYPEYQRNEYGSLASLKAAMSHCSNPREVFTMLSDGSVVVCCHDFDRFTYYGNIFEQEVLEIWNSPVFKKDRWNILDGNPPQFCLEKCMTFVPTKECAAEIVALGKGELEKMPVPKKEKLVQLGSEKKAKKPELEEKEQKPLVDQSPEATTAPANEMPETRFEDFAEGKRLRGDVDPDLIRNLESPELRALGERLLHIESEIGKLGDVVGAIALHGGAVGSLRVEKIVEEKPAMFSQRYQKLMKRVRRKPKRFPITCGASANEAIIEAKTCFQQGRHNEGADIFEQLVEVCPEQQAEILAELFDLYKGLPNSKNRYTLYVSRHFDFNIQPGDKVLDIGSGHDPFPYATHLSDIAAEDDHFGRAGVPLKRVEGLPFTECSVEDMPFDDGEFDFVYCSHVLEHTVDPARACSELARVAKRGYIETPSRGKDLWLNSAKVSNHHWGVENIGGRLIFTEYSPEDVEGIGADILMAMHCSPETIREKAFSALIWLKAIQVNTMLYWEDQISCEVRRLTRLDEESKGVLVSDTHLPEVQAETSG